MRADHRRYDLKRYLKARKGTHVHHHTRSQIYGSPYGSPSRQSLLRGGISAGVGWLAYQLLLSMVQHFPPISPDTARLAQRISILLRYVLVGSTALVAFMFGVIGLGLLGYGIQLVLTRAKSEPEAQDPGLQEEG